MTPERRRRSEELFLDAVELPAAERAGFLQSSCGSDADLRREVETLLRHDGAGEFLESGGVGVRAAEVLDSLERGSEAPPQIIDGYKLLRRIGRGGTGTVYEAEQQHPRRIVALKVVHGGPGTHGLRRRFQREIQVLGQLTHPGIAQIYDAGVAIGPTGTHPYFAMELVHGSPLTEFARSHDLGVRQRLAIVADICDAVQFAHDKGIIHRDLKPANILVSDAGTEARRHEGTKAETAKTEAHPPLSPLRASVPPCLRASPKILDFGVARLIDADVQLTIERTGVAQIIGTLPYMSPEQFGGRSAQLDTRSDVYSLGVILYELIAGRLPHDVRDRSLAEAARAIQQDEPTRLSSINTIFRGDIETIVIKALEKDPERRYLSAAALAADIRRYLRDEPIHARPASTLYQLRKFAKRNRALVGALCMVMVSLIVATFVSTRFAISEARQRAVADRRAHRANILAAQSKIADADPVQARRILDLASPAECATWEWRYLRAALDTADKVLTGHEGPVLSVCHLPGSDRIVSASEDGTLRVWDVESGEMLRTLRGHSAAVSRVRCADALGHVVSGSNDGTIRVWDSDTGDVLREMSTGGTVLDLVLSADGTTAYAIVVPDHAEMGAWGQRSEYQVWNLNTAALEVSHPNLGSQQNLSIAPACDPDELLFGTGTGIDRRALQTGERIELQQGAHDMPPSRLVRGASLLASCAVDKSITLWDATTITMLRHLRGHIGPVYAVALGPGDALLASGGGDQTLRLWNTQTGMQTHALLGHEGMIRDISFAPDGSHVASAADDGTVRVWRLTGAPGVSGGKVCRGHDGPVYDVAFSPGGHTFASAGWGDGTLRIWNGDTGELIATPVEGARAPHRLAFSHDGRLLACGADSATVLHVATGAIRKLGGAGEHVRSIAFSADDRTLVTTATSMPRRIRGFVRIWDIDGGAMRQDRELAGDSLVAESPAGLRVAIFAADGARMIDALSGRELFAFAGHAGAAVERFAFSNDGTRFVTASHDRTAVVWDARDGHRIGTLRGHAERVYDAAFSPDGSRIATCSNDNSIRIWAADTFEEILELRGHERYVHAVAFSDDGILLVSASGDGTLRVWTAPASERHAGSR
ncbi:MAG: WD40 repeat domain-containing serine/threonine protein kinase [Phycisphaerae bacterium]